MNKKRWLMVAALVVICGAAAAVALWPSAKKRPAVTGPLVDRVEVILHPNCSKKVLELIRRSTKEIYLSSHQSSGKKVAAALVDAHHRGVRITIALDKRKYQDNIKRSRGRKVSIIDPLRDVGATTHLFDTPGYPYLHSKIILVDGKIVVGSMNVEDRDDQRDNYLVFEDELLYERYKDLFEHYLDDESYDENFEYDDGPKEETIEAYFGPAPDFLPPLIKLIDEAKESIRISVVDLNHPPVVEALESAVKRGVTAHIAITEFMPRIEKKHLRTIESAVALSEAGARVVWKQGGVHHKVMVVDDRVTLLGSPGFETLPLTVLFETYLIVYSREIAQKYTTEIDFVMSMRGADEITQQNLDTVREKFEASH